MNDSRLMTSSQARRSRRILLSLALAVWTCGAGAQRMERAPNFSGDDLVAAPRSAWPTNGGDWYNRRYSPLSQINRANVARLRGVWRARLGGSGVGPQYSGEAQPIVYDGVIYIVTGAADVFAIDVETGERLWAYAAGLDPEIDTACCGWVARG
ncbi:MAG: PQQ-binding-like beta-propeller repeat protein, partial [Gammaproteobacteria bacterium]